MSIAGLSRFEPAFRGDDFHNPEPDIMDRFFGKPCRSVRVIH
jgi:hypothetical protein